MARPKKPENVIREKFEKANPAQKVELLNVVLSHRPKFGKLVLDLFQNGELCVVCGGKTKLGDRFMMPIDGAWPNGYFNLWRCRECKLIKRNALSR